jgi:hypothetical protein
VTKTSPSRRLLAGGSVNHLQLATSGLQGHEHSWFDTVCQDDGLTRWKTLEARPQAISHTADGMLQAVDRGFVAKAHEDTVIAKGEQLARKVLRKLSCENETEPTFSPATSTCLPLPRFARNGQRAGIEGWGGHGSA